jgi:hypothetical protein
MPGFHSEGPARNRNAAAQVQGSMGAIRCSTLVGSMPTGGRASLTAEPTPMRRKPQRTVLKPWPFAPTNARMVERKLYVEHARSIGKYFGNTLRVPVCQSARLRAGAVFLSSQLAE